MWAYVSRRKYDTSNSAHFGSWDKGYETMFYEMISLKHDCIVIKFSDPIVGYSLIIY